jgi:hypothetical protein
MPGCAVFRLGLVALVGLVPLYAFAAGDRAPQVADGETVQQALCRLVESASTSQGLPVPFLTRLIWQESSFRADVISRAGAQGVAQFMPGTARERGLADPFDPEQAIPAAAALLSDLARRFGNLGFAAAAYNAGPGRVSAWIQGSSGLPAETRDYVLRITGRSAEDWAAAAKAQEPAPNLPGQSCLQVTADLRRPGSASPVLQAALAPWGVQLAGNFSKEVALASYARARQSYAAIIGDIQPMVIGTRLRSRGSRPFYRVRVPAQTRAAADAICERIQAARGSCVTLRS